MQLAALIFNAAFLARISHTRSAVTPVSPGLAHVTTESVCVRVHVDPIEVVGGFVEDQALGLFNEGERQFQTSPLPGQQAEARARIVLTVHSQSRADLRHFPVEVPQVSQGHLLEKVVVFVHIVCASSLLRPLLHIPRSPPGQQVGARVESFANPVQVGEAELQVVRDAERRLVTRGVARRRGVGVYLSFGGGEFSAGEAQDRCFSRAVGADQAEAFSAAAGEGDVAQDFSRWVGERDALKNDG